MSKNAWCVGAASLILCCAVGAVAAGDATEEEGTRAATAAKPRTERAEPEVPFGFALAKTTLEAAQQQWARSGLQPAARAHAAIGAGSGRDGLASLGASRILLVDIAEAEFEIKRSARLVFYDGVLYSVQVKLADILATGKEKAEQLDKEALARLEADLRRKYGPPTRALSDLFAKKRPNLLIWEFKGNHLTFYTGGLRPAMLTYSNQRMVKEAERYKKAECAKVEACSGKKA